MDNGIVDDDMGGRGHKYCDGGNRTWWLIREGSRQSWDLGDRTGWLMREGGR